jgi:hypothetical protein
MTLDFQENVLKFVLQTKSAKKYAELLDSTCFDQPIDKVIFGLFQEYVKKYAVVPAKASLIELFNREVQKKQDIAKEVQQAVELRIRDLYQPFNEETALIRESILEFSKRKQTKELFRENADKVKTGDEQFFSKLMRQMSNIAGLTDDTLEEEKNRGGLLLNDFEELTFEMPVATEIFLRGINKMTAAGGFYSPQLVVMLAPPKSFKTGVVLKTAIELVRNGERVYYADTENGIRSIQTRAFQAMLECELHELSGLKSELNQIVTKFGALGGDMEIDFYPARSKTLDDVEAELEYLRDEHNWTPTVIIYDYLDLFEPSPTARVTENRFKIQHVYHHAVRINNKWNTWSLTISPAAKGALEKEVINMKDFAEDFAKAYNCHAAFAICRTPDEVEAGIARIVPVAQREGVRYKFGVTCYIKMEEAKMVIEEITKEEADDLLDEVRQERPQEKGKSTRRRNRKKDVKDE